MLGPVGLWGHIVDTYNPYLIEAVGAEVVQFIFWWIPCIFFVTLPWTAPTFSERHKFQPAPKQPGWPEIRHAALYSFRNQVMVAVIHSGLTYLAYKTDRKALVRITAELPSLKEFVSHLVLSHMIREVTFYHIHRMFHWRPLYKRIHKMHHKFTAPVAFASQYAHPIEHIFANTLPIVVPPMLLGAHILTLWSYVAIELFETSVVHSGYNFIYPRLSKEHDRHHERFDVYFGVNGLLDWAYGTDERARKPRDLKKA